MTYEEYHELKNKIFNDPDVLIENKRMVIKDEHGRQEPIIEWRYVSIHGELVREIEIAGGSRDWRQVGSQEYLIVEGIPYTEPEPVDERGGE